MRMSPIRLAHDIHTPMPDLPGRETVGHIASTGTRPDVLTMRAKIILDFFADKLG
jgi:hypothetical protein